MLHNIAPKTARQIIALLDANVEVMLAKHNGEGEFACDDATIAADIADALVLEYTSWLTYFTFGNIVRGIWREPVATMFFEHADQELEHAKQLLLWLSSINIAASPVLNVQVPYTIKIQSMLDILVDQEQQAIAQYKKLLKLAGTKTGFEQLIESIIQTEQEHSNELKLLTDYPCNCCNKQPCICAENCMCKLQHK